MAQAVKRPTLRYWPLAAGAVMGALIVGRLATLDPLGVGQFEFLDGGEPKSVSISEMRPVAGSADPLRSQAVFAVGIKLKRPSSRFRSQAVSELKSEGWQTISVGSGSLEFRKGDERIHLGRSGKDFGSAESMNGMTWVYYLRPATSMDKLRIWLGSPNADAARRP